MTPNKLPLMSLSPIKSIGPSQFVRMKNCRLREVWSANRDVPVLLPRGLEARVGSVIHRLCQIANGGKGLPNCTSAEQAWDYLIQAQEAEMQTSLLESHLLPIANHLWNYGTKKALCLRSINPVLPVNSSEATGEDYSRLLGAEVPVWDSVQRNDATVSGSIDLVELSSEGYILTDLKTGAVLDDTGAVKEEYQHQLRLYAAMFAIKAMHWPTKLVVIGLDGLVCDVPFTQDQCQALLAEAQQLREETNQQIRDGVTMIDLATPTSDNCRHCSFRPACPSYWNARQETSEWPNDVRGQLVATPFLQRNGNTRIQLTMLDREVTLCDLPGQPAPGSLKTGDYISAYSVVPEYNRLEKVPWENHFCAGPMTTIYL